MILFHYGMLPFGWAGVWTFYVVSGFVITGMFLSRGMSAQAHELRRFFVQRAARIWPLYFLVVGLSVLYGALYPGEEITLPQILTLTTFTFNFYEPTDPASHVFSHLWTISVEQQFYLVFPFLFAWSARHRIRNTSLMLAGFTAMRLAAGFALAQAGIRPEAAGSFIYFFSLGHFDAFMAGSLLALNVDRFAERRFRRLVFGLAGAACLAYAASVYVSIDLRGLGLHPPHPRKIWLALKPFIFEPSKGGTIITSYLMIVAVSCALITSALAPASRASSLLRRPFLVQTGRISFGLYLWHPLIGYAVYRVFGIIPLISQGYSAVLALPFYLAASWGVAWLSYTLFERRFHQRGPPLVHPALGAERA